MDKSRIILCIYFLYKMTRCNYFTVDKQIFVSVKKKKRCERQLNVKYNSTN